MVTMRDVAVHAGVSRVTVSYVLNKKDALIGISDDTRTRVLRAADELGYRRNELARAMVTGKNAVFAFLVPPDGVESEVTARILTGILQSAEEMQHTVQVVRLPTLEDRSVIQRCVEMRPMGVMTIYTSQNTLDQLHEEMNRYRIPVAVLDCSYPQAQGSRILSDDTDGCRQVIDHLGALGHRRIAFIGGYSHMGVSLVRSEGYRRAMQTRGLPIPEGYQEYGEWLPERVESITRGLFNSRNSTPFPTAVFCADDKTAMVVCRTLHRIGMSVPDTVSVVGFADLAMARYNNPPLTTVAQPFRAMGQAAVERLFTVASEWDDSGSTDGAYDLLLPTELVVRESTAPVTP